MANVTVTVPVGLKERMRKFKDVNWSAVARQAIEAKVALLSTMDLLLKDSDLTEEDIDRESRAIKKRVWKKHKKI